MVLLAGDFHRIEVYASYRHTAVADAYFMEEYVGANPSTDKGGARSAFYSMKVYSLD
jgi:hypothetical protein